MKQPNNEVSILPQLNKACGLDLHKDKIVLFISDKEGQEQQLAEFGTFTEDLYRIRDYLIAHQSPNCLMESTGIYWMSLYSILTAGGIEVIVANAMHIKQIPKRKTDRKDARWLCTLLLHGLVKKSFIPDAVQQELRDYCRMRLSYTQERARVLNRMIKILEINNIKIRSVLSNIHTKTGLEMLRLLAQGETDQQKLLACMRGKARKKEQQFKLALQATLKEHHCRMLQMLLKDMDHYQRQIDLLNESITQLVEEHYAEVAQCLDNISGIAQTSAQNIISEIGADMSRFPTADHLTSWCGVSPGNNESAGKRKYSGVKKGNKYIRPALIAIAWAAVRTKDSYWRGLYYHLRKRMPAQKAITIIARRLLKVVYKTIRDKSIYQEKGLQHFVDLQSRKSVNKLIESASISFSK